MLATILSIIGVLIPILQNQGVIGSSATTLISNLLAPVETLLANIKGGTSKMQDALAALGAMSGVIAALKANTAISADVLAQVNGIDLDIQKALSYYVQAEGGYNASLYTQIAPVA